MWQDQEITQSSIWLEILLGGRERVEAMDKVKEGKEDETKQ